MGSRSKLQGTPWHYGYDWQYLNRVKELNDQAAAPIRKYEVKKICVYNNQNCQNKISSHYNQNCIGFELCPDFVFYKNEKREAYIEPLIKILEAANYITWRLEIAKKVFTYISNYENKQIIFSVNKNGKPHRYILLIGNNLYDLSDQDGQKLESKIIELNKIIKKEIEVGSAKEIQKSSNKHQKNIQKAKQKTEIAKSSSTKVKPAEPVPCPNNIGSDPRLKKIFQDLYNQLPQN